MLGCRPVATRRWLPARRVPSVRVTAIPALSRSTCFRTTPLEKRSPSAVRKRWILRPHVLVLARQEARALLDHRHLAAEAVEHLGELEADVAAAEHDQMGGERGEIEHPRVGEEGDGAGTGEAGERGQRRASPHVDEDPGRLELAGPSARFDPQLARTGEARVAEDDLDARVAPHPLLHA